MEKCLLFTFPKMEGFEGWNIWWSTWPNKLCNYPLVFMFPLFFARRPHSTCNIFRCACGYLITNWAMNRTEITPNVQCSLSERERNIKLLKRFLLTRFCLLMFVTCVHLVSLLFDDKNQNNCCAHVFLIYLQSSKHRDGNVFSIDQSFSLWMKSQYVFIASSTRFHFIEIKLETRNRDILLFALHMPEGDDVVEICTYFSRKHSVHIVNLPVIFYFLRAKFK